MPLNHGRGAVAAIASLLGGAGFGIALVGRPARAFAWLGAEMACLCAILVTPWMAETLLVLHLAATVDTYLIARRSEQPLRLLAWPPPALFAMGIIGPVLLRAFVLEAFKIPSSAMYPSLVIGDHVFVNKLRTPERGDVVVFSYPCDRRMDYVKRVVAFGGETVEVRCNILYIDGKAVHQTLVAAATSYEDYDEERDEWYPRNASRYREELGNHPHDVFHDPGRPDRERTPPQEGDARDFPSRTSPLPTCSNTSDEHSGADTVPGRIVVTKTDASVCEPQVHFVVPDGQLFVLGDNRNNSNDSRVWGVVPTGNVKGVVSNIWWSNGKHVDLGRIGRFN